MDTRPSLYGVAPGLLPPGASLFGCRAVPLWPRADMHGATDMTSDFSRVVAGYTSREAHLEAAYGLPSLEELQALDADRPQSECLASLLRGFFEFYSASGPGTALFEIDTQNQPHTAGAADWCGAAAAPSGVSRSDADTDPALSGFSRSFGCANPTMSLPNPEAFVASFDLNNGVSDFAFAPPFPSPTSHLEPVDVVSECGSSARDRGGSDAQLDGIMLGLARMQQAALEEKKMLEAILQGKAPLGLSVGSGGGGSGGLLLDFHSSPSDALAPSAGGAKATGVNNNNDEGSRGDVTAAGGAAPLTFVPAVPFRFDKMEPSALESSCPANAVSPKHQFELDAQRRCDVAAAFRDPAVDLLAVRSGAGRVIRSHAVRDQFAQVLDAGASMDPEGFFATRRQRVPQ
jgi:hypothetical protein